MISTTSVALNGRIDLLAAYNIISNPPRNAGFLTNQFLEGSVVLGAGSISQILPEWSSTDTALVTQSRLPSQLNVAGASVYLDGSVIVPSGNVTIGNTTIAVVGPTSTNQIFIDSQGLIDVSGSQNVQASVAETIVQAQLRGAELADSPLQRNGPLRGQTVFVDATVTGKNPDGSTWIGTPVGDVSGWVALVPHTIGELTTNGGQISLIAHSNVANSSTGDYIVVQPGAVLNVSGGWINYQGAFVQTTRVVGTDGRIYDISQASPNQTYSGILGGFTVAHPHWGVMQTYNSPLLSGLHFEQGYIQGGDAGTLTIQAPATVLDGAMYGAVFAGPKQRQAPPSSSIANGQLQILDYAGTDITDLVQGLLPTPGTLNLSFFIDDPSSGVPTPNVTFERALSNSTAATNAYSQAIVAVQFDRNGNPVLPALSADRQANVFLSPDLLAVNGFSNLTVNSPDGNIVVNSDLIGRPSGSIALTGANITIANNTTISVPGGTLNFSTNRSPSGSQAHFTLGADASLNVDGLVIDARAAGRNAAVVPLVLNGGQVSITSLNLDLVHGSAISADGGISIPASGKPSNGNGGGITISAGFVNGGTQVGNVTLDAALEAYAPSTGGSLSMSAPSIVIGGPGATSATGLAVDPTRPGVVLVAPDFFNAGIGGFASLSFAGHGSVVGGQIGPGTAVTIAPGTTFAPVAQNLILMPGDDLTPALLLPAVGGTAVNLTLSVAGANLVGFVMGQSSSIIINPTIAGAGRVTIGSGGTATILGQIIVPGGSISVSGGSSTVLFPPESTSEFPALATVDLGPNSVLSTAGAAVIGQDALGRPTGRAFGGGLITVSGNIVAEKGAVLDVSGAAANLFEPIVSLGRARPSGLSPLSALTPIRVDSNGGTITLTGLEELFTDATLRGFAGGSDANGGTLALSSGYLPPPDGLGNRPIDPTHPTLNLTQSGATISAKNTEAAGGFIGQAVLDANGNPLTAGGGYFAVNDFVGDGKTSGGFDSLALNGVVNFIGNVSISARGSVIIGGAGISIGHGISINTLTMSADPSNPTVAPSAAIVAPYIAIGAQFTGPIAPGQQQFVTAPGIPTSGPGTLTLTTTSGLIDVGSVALRSIGAVNLTATNGDIRGSGVFEAAGAITMTAGQVYPATESIFTIAAFNTANAAGSVTFNGSGARQAPFSAGGELNVYATIITQDGVLRAPIGIINLGSTTPVSTGITGTSFATTTTLTLGAGSVTSVSAGGRSLTAPSLTASNGSIHPAPTSPRRVCPPN